MTRCVKLVNTSNWHHEDIEVVMVNGTHPVHRKRLAPGDSLDIGPWGKHLDDVTMLYVKPVEDKEPVPFRKPDGGQDWPTVEVHKPIAGSEPEPEAA